MQVIVTKTVITSIGALNVIVQPDKPNWYVGDNASASIGWSPFTGNSCTLVINWGDGTIETKTVTTPASHVHKYTVAKSPYPVVATVTDNVTKATGSGQGTLNVAAMLTVAPLTADPTTGPAPLTVTFTIAYGGGYSPITATLSYDDGTSDSVTVGTKVHIYTEGGKTYVAKLTVTDAMGASLTQRTVRLFTSPVEWWQTATDMEKAALATAGVLGIIAVAYLAKKKLGKHR